MSRVCAAPTRGDVLAALLDAAPWPDTDMDVLAAMLGPLEALEDMLDWPVSGACP